MTATCPRCELPAEELDPGAVRCPEHGLVVVRSCCVSLSGDPHGSRCKSPAAVQRATRRAHADDWARRLTERGSA